MIIIVIALIIACFDWSEEKEVVDFFLWGDLSSSVTSPIQPEIISANNNLSESEQKELGDRLLNDIMEV